MGRYEWAHGEIILPSAAFAPFRKAVQDAVHAKWQKAYDDSQRFWKSLSAREKADWDLFRRALNARRYDNDTEWLCDPRRVRDEKPRRALQSDVDWPTNRTTEFNESDLRLTFIRENRTLVYDVASNKSAREHALNTTLATAFHDQITKVRWTHGTGGVILGNDEYNEESGRNHEGGGGSYVVAAYGYIGAKEAPTHVGEFLNGKGQRMHVETTYTRTGVKGKIVAGPKPKEWTRTSAWFG